MAGLLSKERIEARPGFSRWLIPPCALATHLCIGQAYALSVFMGGPLRKWDATRRPCGCRYLRVSRSEPALHGVHTEWTSVRSATNPSACCLVRQSQAPPRRVAG